ncbi:ABC transporter substrate-binding protein [Candidatus Poriferisodalis sp.]|uniref:ABC transporter substrate-binding protein n=1 Tax=Candidatus Poriferisodalis sp. TaxID=3101277 RepID=UPI003B01433E
MQLSKNRLLRLLALLFAFSLVAAACGGGDDDDVAETETETTEDMADGEDMAEEDMAEEDMAEGEPEEEAGGLSQDVIEQASEEEEMEEDEEMMEFDRSTIEGIFEEATFRRAQIVERITAHIESGEWGVGDDNVLRGPEGFMIDLNECPEDWSNTEGITDNEIRIGQTGPQSGTLALYGNARLGWQTYLEHVNADGGVAGRNVVMKSYDDAYVAAQTIEFVDELIENDNVFAIHTLGSPNTLAVYDTLNAECIPQPFVWTGHPAWGDPEVHPWTTGSILSYSTESVLWGNWIKENLADELPVVVAGLVMDNDFGLAYELGFEEYAHNNPDVVSEFVPVRHDPASPTITNEITTIAANDPDVYISMTAGNACLLAIQEVAASGLKEEISAAFTSSVCKAPASWISPAGDDGDGWLIVGGGLKDTTDPALIGSDAFIDFIIESLEANDLDPTISMFGNGYMLGYPYVEALRIAAELPASANNPAGLNRANFILAVRAIDIHHPIFLDGITFAMNGNADAFPIEGTDFSQYDSSTHSWIVSNVIDVNGASGNCVWDKDNGGCS